MAKIRVYELAKSLDKDSKEVIEVLKKNGVEVKNHMSSVTDEEAQKVRERFSGKGTVKTPPAEKAAPRQTAEPKNIGVKKNVISAQSGQASEKENSSSPQPQGEHRIQDEKRDANGTRLQGERRPQGDRRDVSGTRPQGERRPQGDRRDANGNRPQGERRPQSDGRRPQGDRRDANG
ncbi:MAG: translation initiation factor IF-2 N-terminal domain-containing protein, partial [Lachnospiraceae bacterium]|nr:translation initiation factor IF-2 N-terminal domain-containing protein [Lachnospiraceae bacterium]